MRKQFWAALALVLLALPPARAQVITPTTPTNPTTSTFTVDILQAQPCTFKRQPVGPQLPAGITWTGCRIAGAGGPDITSTTPACRFVGNVLALDPGADGRFASFTGGGGAAGTRVVQGLKLIKVVPLIPKCPDLWPGQTFIQTGLTGVRTFFPLKFSPCDTTFTLEVEFGIVDPTVPRNISEVRLNRFVFRVTVLPQTLEWIVDALHCQPLGICEVPCITDEALFQTLITQSRAVAAAVGNVQNFNNAIDLMESTVVRNCLFQPQLFQLTDAGVLEPCAIFAGRLPSNATIAAFGFGIVDTVENPCCCKLISDLACLKTRTIGKP
jgi:hypothetical protein